MENRLDSPLVHIVDDDPLLRQALRELLTDNSYDVIEYESAEEFIEADEIIKPSCILLDVRMGGMSGFDLQYKIKERWFAPPIIFLTGSAPFKSAINAMREGAIHFLTKPVSDDVLLSAIAESIEGSIESANFASALMKLTEREQEVFRLVSDGVLSKEIAHQLDISLRTVEFHRKNISDKLN